MKFEELQKLVIKDSFSDEERTLIAEWKNEFPYFSILQWLSDKANGEIGVSSLHKTDLFKYASFFNKKNISIEEVDMPQEYANEAESNTQDMHIQSSESTATQVDAIHTDIKDEHKEPTSQEMNNKTEDIMSLINEVPLNAPIQMEGLQIISHEPSKKEAESQQTQADIMDDKSLMVMMSFTEWLQYFKSKRQKEEEEEQEKKALRSAWQKEKLTAAIEEENDVIPEPIFKQAMESISYEEVMISESLAKVLASQGKIEKAIEMYRKLSLQNPDKSAYFADLIQKLKIKP